MGKKKNQPHQTHSFEQLVAKANREALKPFILEVSGAYANDISNKMFTKLAIFQNRIEALEMVLKTKLGVTQREIDTAIFDLEDKVTGYVQVDRPAQEGDFLRLNMRIKNSKDGYGQVAQKEFANLGKPPYAKGMKFIEEALFGVSAGETKVVPFDAELKEKTGWDEIEFVIDRISELIVKPEAKKEETANAESKDAPQSSGSSEAGQVEPT